MGLDILKNVFSVNSNFLPKTKEVAEKVNEIIKYQTTITLVDKATIEWDLTKAYNATVTLGGNRTLSFTGLKSGDYGTIKIIQDNAGNRTLTLPSNSLVSNDGQGAITLSTAGDAVDVATWYYDGTNLYWNIALNFT